MTCDEVSYTFRDCVKDPGATRLVRLNLFKWAAHFWKGNEYFDLGEFVRPSRGRSTGFAYERTAAGLSACREPRWPTVVGAVVKDGDGEWTCRVAGSNGISPISAPSAVSEPVGLTITDVQVTEDVKVSASYAGGVVDTDYVVVFTFTLDGVTRIARHRVLVRATGQ